VLDCEIEEHPENETLPKVVELLLDHSDELDDDDYQKVTESISTVAAAASGGVTGSTLEDLFSGLILPFLKITGIALLGPVGLVATLSPIWLKKLLDKNDKKQ
jgi:hypothetical protein